MPKYRQAQAFDDGKERLEVPVTFQLDLDQVLAAILVDIFPEVPFGTLDQFNHHDWTDKDLRTSLNNALWGYGIVAWDSPTDNLPDGWRDHVYVHSFRRRLAQLFGFTL